MIDASTRRLLLRAAKNRREIVAAGLSRRDLLGLGLLTSAGYLVAKRGLASSASGCEPGACALGCSPATPPFVLPLPIPPVLQPVTALTGPPPTTEPNRSTNPATGAAFEGRTRPHQFADRFAPVKLYETTMTAAPHVVSPALPPQTIWGFDGLFPGPTLVTTYYEPVLVRRWNNLPPVEDNGGFGVPSVSTHLHNFHSASESDGGPCDYFERGQYYDYRYDMMCAGFDAGFGEHGDERESLGSLWYHDHRVDHTAQNVYKGLAGFHLIFNDEDTGDETTGFRLPSFPTYDVPLMLSDKLFDPDTGEMCFDLFEFDGVLGDKFLVNGVIQPYFEVKRRRYRFRVLNAGPSRFYQLFLTDPRRPRTQIPFWVVGTDSNLLPTPVRVTSIRMGVAERFDIVIDFDDLPGAPGVLVLENRLVQHDGRGPTKKLKPPGRGDALLQFRVGERVQDDSVSPKAAPRYYELPDKTEAPRITRVFEFERENGQWAINGRFADCEEIRFRVKRNSVERWILVNRSGGWQHPIHAHLEEFQTRMVNGVPVTPGSLLDARKDVFSLGENQTVELFFRFRDYRGRYPLHCHNTIHEDHSMMIMFEVDDEGDLQEAP